MTVLPAEIQAGIDAAVDALRTGLGDNLHSCILYGSAVRGGFVPRASDINLLIVLQESTPLAHGIIAHALAGRLTIDPFVLGRPGMERSFAAFALRFQSIRRDYRVLHGADVLAGMKIDREIERFLCEQALRHARLRLVHGYIVDGAERTRYARQLLLWQAGLFIDISAALRLEGVDVPSDFPSRVAVIGDALGMDASVLADMLLLKENPYPLSAADVEAFHARIYALLTRAIEWTAERWPSPAV